MNRFHHASPADLRTLYCLRSNTSGRKFGRDAEQCQRLSHHVSVSTRRRLHVAVAATALIASSLLVMSPAMAQLRGDWPTDVHLTRVSDADPSHADRFNVRGSDNRVDVPRGDLRKDVADAARTDPRRPAR